MPSRKRALTGREAAEEEEADRARARRRDAFEAKTRDAVDDIMEQLEREKSQDNDDIAAQYSHDPNNRFSVLSSPQADSDDDASFENEDEFPDISEFISPIPSIASSPPITGPSTALTAQIRYTLPPSKGLATWKAYQQLKERQRSPTPSSEPTLSQIRSPIKISSDSNDDDTVSIALSVLPSLEQLAAQALAIPPSTAPLNRDTSNITTLNAPPLTAPASDLSKKRSRKPTAKQVSQNRRDEEKRQKREAKNKKKPKSKDII